MTEHHCQSNVYINSLHSIYITQSKLVVGKTVTDLGKQ